MESTSNEEMIMLIALTKQVIDDHDMLVRQNQKLKQITALFSGSQDLPD